MHAGRSEHRELPELGDFEGYQSSFLRLFGFGLEGVDYAADWNSGTGSLRAFDCSSAAPRGHIFTGISPIPNCG
jgi:hypothetical protein